MNFRNVVFLLAIILIAGCNNSAVKDPQFILLPQVKEFSLSGEKGIRPGDVHFYFSSDGTEMPAVNTFTSALKAAKNEEDADILFSLDSSLSLQEEGYILKIENKRVEIKAKDRAGLLYAFVSLEQLCQDAIDQKIEIPGLTIQDYPSLSYRAIHLDMKHHLEKEEYYYEIIDRLFSYKVNAIIAEFEDKLAYQRQPLVAAPDAMSIETWKKISEYAMQRNIEISPLIQGLGHASFILKHEEYKDIRDNPDSDWAFNPLDPRTYDVQFDLYLDAIEATPYGRYLHVGGDEVHTNGRGSGKSSIELQMRWLNKVSEFATEHHRIPIFWDDMVLKHGGLFWATLQPSLSNEELDALWEKGEQKLMEFIDLFPENCIYMRWNYDAPLAPGNQRAMQWYADNKLMMMGATAGQTRWDLMPQNSGNQKNIKDFAQSSIDKDLDALLLTLWDDDSPLFELYWRGIIFFSEYTWAGAVRDDESVKAAYRHREFGHKLGDPDLAFIDRLEKPVAFWARAAMMKNSRKNLHRFADPKTEVILNLPDPNNKGAWTRQHEDRLVIAEEMIKHCDTVSMRLEQTKEQANRHQHTLDVYEQVNRVARFSPYMLLKLKEFDQATVEESAAILEEIRSFDRQFNDIRTELEEVYGKTRILNKAEDYVLDQDHHNHSTNQTINFDWPFQAELLFIEKIDDWTSLMNE